ncbi:unannotated protein [freshwater metagenome]|uniref:Unannotated protein n=1 Tax=freshwater metagenome TaxID=449393 RepID=A0A6J5YA81_9ZZZZ
MRPVGLPSAASRPGQAARASLALQEHGHDRCYRSGTCRLSTPVPPRAAAVLAHGSLVGHVTATQRRASLSAPECVATPMAGSARAHLRGVASNGPSHPDLEPLSPRRGWCRCDLGSRRSSVSPSQSFRKGTPTPLTHPVEPPGVPDNHRRHDPGIDLDPVPVAAGRRVDRHDLDVVVPDPDRPTELTAAQSPRRIVNRCNVQMVSREGQKTEKEYPPNHGLARAPLIMAATDDRHCQEATRHRSKGRGRLDRSPDGLGRGLDGSRAFDHDHDP